MLDEIIVTAKESDGLTGSSRIDRNAMNHLQPTSFTDLLELLPGNISQNPEMGKANTISLRETGNLGASGTKVDNNDYVISSLGTLFLVDGAPINGDANLQSVGLSTDATSAVRDITNRGVDMRSISTDNIHNVEIIRGIPSAEYGNLTSGVVKITRINTSTPITARFKADEYSKLFSIGKGFSIHKYSPLTLNADMSFLDARTDPRNNLENYKRLTGSLRMTLRKSNDNGIYNLSVSADYTGSFDNTKIDKDLTLLKIDEYKSSFNRLNLTSEFSAVLDRPLFFNDFEFNFSCSYQIDRLMRRKQVAPQRASIAPTSMNPGEHIGAYLLGEYIADFESDGRSLCLFLKARASGIRSTGILTHNYKAGIEWNFSKNFGKGQIYDLTRPLSANWTSRPRAFHDIPSLQVLSLFLEDRMDIEFGFSTLSLQTGVRSIMLPALDNHYYLARRPFFDPRINLGWELKLGNYHHQPAHILFSAGFGLTTRMPTIDYLFPQAQYNDIIQLNYYDIRNPHENSIVSIVTYINDAVNYNLHPARNKKWEIRCAFRCNGLRASITYFREKMTDGFRFSSVYAPYSYKKYDTSAIDAGNLVSPPDLSKIPYSEEMILKGYRQASNGTRINKEGIEWQISTPRWKALRTALTVSGAWFHSTYSNSEMLFSTVPDVVNGIPVNEHYIGLYDFYDGRINDQVTTNFMFDTQIPKWGLIFTTSFQCLWHVRTKRIPINGVPTFYLNADDGLLHPFQQDLNNNPLLNYLIKTYNATSFETFSIPFAGYINIKATKTLGNHLRIALFVNRILDYLPSYHSNGLLVRRSSNPYFGMELNLIL